MTQHCSNIHARNLKIYRFIALIQQQSFDNNTLTIHTVCKAHTKYNGNTFSMDFNVAR